MLTKFNLALATLCLLTLFGSAVGAELEVENYRGWVITVLDGDTVRVLDGGNRMTRVRLKGIDAPEKDQPFGTQSREHLSSLLAGKEVKVEATSTDDFGNILGRILVEPPDCDGCANTLDVNLSLLSAGLAWWLPKFAHQQSRHERKAYQAAEQQARQDNIGLWSDAEPVPPWEWRARTGIHTAEGH